MKLTHKTLNPVTGEETIIEVEETTAEKKAREKYEADVAIANAAAAANAIAKSALLERLGITADEAKLLIG